MYILRTQYRTCPCNPSSLIQQISANWELLPFLPRGLQQKLLLPFQCLNDQSRPSYQIRTFCFHPGNFRVQSFFARGISMSNRMIHIYGCLWCVCVLSPPIPFNFSPHYSQDSICASSVVERVICPPDLSTGNLTQRPSGSSLAPWVTIGIMTLKMLRMGVLKVLLIVDGMFHGSVGVHTM